MRNVLLGAIVILLSACASQTAPPAKVAITAAAPVAQDANPAFLVTEPGPEVALTQRTEAARARATACGARADAPTLAMPKCLAGEELLVEALAEAQLGLANAVAAANGPQTFEARALLTSIQRRMPHVTFVASPRVELADVRFDGRAVQTDQLSRLFSVDPGVHHVIASGTVDGRPFRVDRTYDVPSPGCTTIALDIVPARAGEPERTSSCRTGNDAVSMNAPLTP